MARRQRRIFLLGGARAPKLRTTDAAGARFPGLAVALVPLLVVGALSALSGCTSLVSEGKVGDREVRLDGTGFAWLDETFYTLDDGAVTLRTRPSDDTVLNLMFTSAVFDPTVDLRSLSVAERARVEDALRTADQLFVRVRRGDRLLPGDELVFTSSADPPDAAPFIASAALRLGTPPLEPGAAYPPVVEGVARGLRVALHVTEVAPRVLGELDVRIRRSASDDDGVEGDVRVRFDVERVPERIAECNFDAQGAGSAHPCDELQLLAP